jgi:hypothetical protein
MITVREAIPADGLSLAEFFLRTPIEAGGEFVLDRSPDFSALLRMRGESRTFLALAGSQLAGTASALWHDAPEGQEGRLRIGEVVDLRVAEWARGGPATVRLLRAVRGALDAAGVDWAVCLIGDRNAAAVPLVRGAAGLPELRPLARYASVHFAACRLPGTARPKGITVREATRDDGASLRALMEESLAARRFTSLPEVPWPDPAGMHRSWLALDPSGRPCGGLIVWDGSGVRRIRVTRYRGTDRLFRAVIGLAARFGLASALPPPGGVLRLWASRWLGVRGDRRDVVRALVHTALRGAAGEGVHILQINLAEGDPVLRSLPRALRSFYWSTLYGCALGAGRGPEDPAPEATYHADLALV